MLLLGSGLGAALPAGAQERVPSATGSSDRAAFQPQGFPLGGFRVYPTLRISGSYDDNVLVRGSDKRGDAVLTVSPQARAQSQWSRHALTVDAYARANRYARRGQLDREEYGVASSGRLDVLRTWVFTGAGSYARSFEQRGTPGDLDFVNRYIGFEEGQASVGISNQFNRVTVGVGAAATGLRYDTALGGGNLVNQRFRDRNIGSVNGRVSYQYSAITSLFVAGTANRVRYRGDAASTIDRASDGYNVLGGARFEITRLLSGEVGLGYLNQSFRDPRYSDFSGLNYSLRLNYQPTALTGVSVTADRQLTDSALFQVGGVLASRVGVAVDHELLRNVLLAADLGYVRYTYRGLDRTDNRWTAGAGVRYRMSRYLSTALSYNRVSQSRDAAFGRDFSSNRFTLSLIASR